MDINDIRFAKDGDVEALEKIIVQLTPMIKKYALKVMHMDLEDTCQEIVLNLIEAVYKMDYVEDLGQAYSYFRKCIRFKVSALKREAESNIIKTEKLKREFLVKPYENPYENPYAYCDLLLDIEMGIQGEDEERKKRYIHFARMGLTENEIAQRFSISRQWLYKWKKDALSELKKLCRES